MPSYLAVYEDTAPFFTYSGAWVAGSSRDDRSAEQYSESSFMVTQSTGASFSFKFYGTEVGIFGSKRVGHGAYQASLDGVPSPAAFGSADPGQFKASLFTGTAQKGFHNVTLTNMEARFLDVDFVSWMASVGRDDEPLIVNTRQDSDPGFAYNPPDAWTTRPPSVGAFSGANGHATSTIGASVTLTFKGVYLSLSFSSLISSHCTLGDAIAVYGPAGPNGASAYSVQLNRDPPSTHTSFKAFYRPRQLLYYGANLGAGTHTVTLKLDSIANQTQMLAIDYAEIYTTRSLGGSFDGASSSASNPGLIAGIAFLSVLSLIALGFIAVLFFLYKKGRFNFAPSSSSKSEEGGVDWSESAYPTYLPTEHGVGFGQGAVNGGPENYDLNSTTSPTSGRAMSSSGHGPVSPAQGTAYTSSSSRVLSPQDDYSIQAAPSTSRSTNPSQPPAFPSSKRVLLATNQDSNPEEVVASPPPPAYMS